MHKWWLALVNLMIMYADDPGNAGGDNGSNGDGGGDSGDKGGAGGNPAGGDGDGNSNGGDPANTPPADDKSKAGDNSGKPNDPPPPVWPENWREDYAKGDEKMLNRLKRFNSPKDVIDSYIAADKKLTSGQLKTALPKDAKPEELDRWRQENGIPAEAKGYLDTLDLGDLQLGEADQAIVADFFMTAHENNMHPNEVNAAIGWYFDYAEREGALEAQRISATKMESESELHKEWGDMYKANLTAAVTLLEKTGDDLKDYVLSATGPDGLPLGNNPKFLRFLAQTAKELDPAATVVPGSGTNSSRAIEDEIAALEKRMREDRDGWFKDEKAQARHRELLAARERINGR